MTFSKPAVRRSAAALIGLTAATVFVVLIAPFQARAGDNIEGTAGLLAIIDRFWDRRLYSGANGFDSSILWQLNPNGLPNGIDQQDFIDAVQAGFDTWASMDDSLAGPPLVPIVTYGGESTAQDVGAVDGVNLVRFAPVDGGGGTLAVAPCTWLTSAATTIDDGNGNTVLPVRPGVTIPFPGPIGVTYRAGTAVDCGIVFDSDDSWGFGDQGFDIQSIGTHEEGHFLSMSHSTIGLTESVGSADDATMIPFVSTATDLRTPKLDDAASLIRSYARANFESQIQGGFARIMGRVARGAACAQPATGVSVRAYVNSEGFNGARATETFSGSTLRPGLPGEPKDGSFELNVYPFSSYNIALLQLDSDFNAAPSAFRFNLTTALGNSKEAGTLRTEAAQTGFLLPGQTVDVGVLGVDGCVPAN